MADTIYNWGREKTVINPNTHKKNKIPTQMEITELGLKPSAIPVHHEPYTQPIMSRGFMDYDPLENA